MKSKKKQTYLEKLEILSGKKPDEAYLLHYGSYFNLRTVEEAAKGYFLGSMTEPKEKVKAKALGLI